MCGIAGSYGGLLNADQVAAMVRALRHRGPDAEGVKVYGDSIHGHTRLSIIDLASRSNQPFSVPEGVLSFNGEIWNHKDVRSDLEAIGREFRTSSDTEVLAQALAEYGVRGALDRIEGMFAFAWSTPDENVLARDRFGKVPLYVNRRDGSRFAWASERKALAAADLYGAAPLPAGSFLDLASGAMHRWYTPRPKLRDDEPGPVLEGFLREGVENRLMSDAPVCCLVSGGLDSAAILSETRKMRPDVTAYTAYHDPASEDLQAARRLCSEFEVELVEVHLGELRPDDLEEAVRVIEIPMKAQVEIAALCLPLARRIASDGFKVCLSGEGADELYGGYGNMHLRRHGGTSWEKVKLEQLSKMARGNFVRCNKSFMAYGVECRLPFLHRPLVEHALGLTYEQVTRPKKKALKQAVAKAVPEWVIKRKKETFQGAGGTAKAAQALHQSPTKAYNAAMRRMYRIGR